ncbi:hypothetical protein Fmac_004078 [Flemingia macrophylla]|uniref:HMA domain-containing protein n=1 Tax=Flemingia macrophylla TaxID=520843 RepID=A0ABD1N3X1_9FABA
MGEEEKKPEETKVEDKKVEEPTKEENKKPDEENKPKESPPPEIVLKVFMHCEGCARKVRRSLKGFPGVEDVLTDCKSHKVVVKGEKADPVKVLERVQRKSHRKVELLSPIPPPPPPPEEEKKPEEKPEAEEKKEEPQVVTVVLKVHMHCEACAQEIKRRIEKMKGVEAAEADLKSSEVSVKGVFETAKLVEHVYKRTGKHAVIVKEEAEKKAEEEKEGEESKKEEGEKKEGEGEKKEGEGEAKAEEGGGEESTVVELKKSEYYYSNIPARYGMELYTYPGHAYPPQIFSDENPNACSVM